MLREDEGQGVSDLQLTGAAANEGETREHAEQAGTDAEHDPIAAGARLSQDEEDLLKVLSETLAPEVAANMWFVVSKQDADGVDCAERRPLQGPAFHNHPNAHPIVDEFYCIRLSVSQLAAQSKRVRMCSYRWTESATSEAGHRLPKNYTWFLEHIRAHSLIGWVDFMSNICVGVPSGVTLGYMGLLYAKFFCCAEYLQYPEKIGDAMKRGWIYQESAFGALDLAMVQQLGVYLHGTQQSLMRAGFDVAEADHTAFFYCCMKVSELLDRRGFGAQLAHRFKAQVAGTSREDDSPWTEWIAGKWDATLGRFGDMVQAKTKYANAEALEVNPDYSFVAYQVVHNTITMSQEDLVAWLSENLNTVPTRNLSVAEFFDLYCLSLVQAYLGSLLTYEEDRDDAVCAVASGIVKVITGKGMSPREILQTAWDHLFLYTAVSTSSQWILVESNTAYLPGLEHAMEVLPVENKWVGEAADEWLASRFAIAVSRGATIWFRVPCPRQCEVYFGCPSSIEAPVFAIVSLAADGEGCWTDAHGTR